MSFFSEARHRFLPVPEDHLIETRPFLDAAGEVIPFFGMYASLKLKSVLKYLSRKLCLISWKLTYLVAVLAVLYISFD